MKLVKNQIIHELVAPTCLPLNLKKNDVHHNWKAMFDVKLAPIKQRILDVYRSYDSEGALLVFCEIFYPLLQNKIMNHFEVVAELQGKQQYLLLYLHHSH